MEYSWHTIFYWFQVYNSYSIFIYIIKSSPELLQLLSVNTERCYRIIGYILYVVLSYPWLIYIIEILCLFIPLPWNFMSCSNSRSTGHNRAITRNIFTDLFVTKLNLTKKSHYYEVELLAYCKFLLSCNVQHRLFESFLLSKKRSGNTMGTVVITDTTMSTYFSKIYDNITAKLFPVELKWLYKSLPKIKTDSAFVFQIHWKRFFFFSLVDFA